MKKILCLILAVMMVIACFAGCQSEGTKAESDYEYVKKKGTLIVGITDFAPMDYTDDNGEWIGFDADLAKAFAKELGVDVKFQLIDWNSKEMELDGKTIDVVWNGMTLTDAVKNKMSTSNPYCNNQQVVVVKKEVAENYKTLESLKTLKFAVEEGSAGQEQVAAIDGAKYVTVLDQATALTEVVSGTADAAVIDLLMASAMLGEGTGFEGLTYTIGLNDEEYGVGFRKGSDLTAKLNEFFKKAYADGTMEELANLYNIDTAVIIPQK